MEDLGGEPSRQAAAPIPKLSLKPVLGRSKAQKRGGLGFRVWGLGFRVWGLGFRVLGEGGGGHDVMLLRVSREHC